MTHDTNPATDEITPELSAKLLNGEITLGQAMGISRANLYEIANVGFQLLRQGKVEEAKEIYRGLVAADPYDSNFHCHLATTLHQSNEFDEALHEYDQALRFNIANIEAFAGRGELQLARGELAEAIKDLTRVLELDPHAQRTATLRARGVLVAVKEAAQRYEQAAKIAKEQTAKESTAS